jgi:uncharacterized membrane protein
MAVEQEKRGSYFSDQDLVLAVYVLYLTSFITGFTGIIGVVIAHVKIGSADELRATHFRFQIRTFWIGLFYVCVGFGLALVLVGFLILLWWCVWTLVRVIKGLMLLNDQRPIAHPSSWLFG